MIVSGCGSQKPGDVGTQGLAQTSAPATTMQDSEKLAITINKTPVVLTSIGSVNLNGIPVQLEQKELTNGVTRSCVVIGGRRFAVDGRLRERGITIQNGFPVIQSSLQQSSSCNSSSTSETSNVQSHKVVDQAKIEYDGFKQSPKVTMICRFLALIILQPIHTIAKMTYHLALPLSIPFEICLAVRREKARGNWSCLDEATRQRCIKIAASRAVQNNIADIVRTPFYEVQQIGLATYGIMLGLFNSNKIYVVDRSIQKIKRIESCHYRGREIGGEIRSDRMISNPPSSRPRT
jgi:hypothetical protein